GLVENITERKQAEEDLQKSEEMARALLNATTDAVVLLDTKGVILDINDTYARQFHKSTDEMLSLCIWDMFPAEVTKPRKANAKQVFKSGKPVRMRDEVHGRRNDIIIYPVCDLKGKVTRVAFFLRDITKELELEEQLRHSQKMETVGLLAGGVAHDFNNMLTPILGYADMALLSLREGDPLYKDIKGIREAAERASALTSQLLAFSRKQVLNLKEVCINKAVTGFNKMLHRIIGEDIELVTALEPSLWKVKADIDQIQQILMNLAVNARDAMSGGGKLTIETENVCLDDEFARIHSDVESGPHVMLSLSDNGRGIDDETMGHIFEPFFTTKELGKGTGLGLSTVYGIVKQHGGSIWVSSKPDLGTAFKIYFPRAEGAAEPATEASDHLRVSPGSETVLVVEDEEMVRKLACDVLSSHGYKTIPARDAVEALQLVKRLNGSVDLLLTDVIMPGINGRELYRRLTAKRSDLKVLYMSGYTHDIIAGHGVLDPGINFIHKPFSLKSLLLKVRETLEN
ncbi:MAG: ATP-binding protein, partial [Gemmatimonadota bacterium]|nr:ATP-binding protein [Gemmatimonadota bacterium]